MQNHINNENIILKLQTNIIPASLNDKTRKSIKWKAILASLSDAWREQIKVRQSNPCSGFLALNIKDPSVNDIDNSLKIILDSMKGIVYLDDDQIKELHVHKTYSGILTIDVIALGTIGSKLKRLDRNRDGW